MFPLLVNVLKGKAKIAKDAEWNDKSTFDENKDKGQFRQYEEACERVKKFYYEQHGTSALTMPGIYSFTSFLRETNYGLQHQGSSQLSQEREGAYGYVTCDIYGILC